MTTTQASKRAVMRQDPERARRMFERRIPDPDKRSAYLQVLADVIERVHSLHPSGWSLTLHAGALKLNVGRVMALDLRNRGLRLYLVEDRVDPAELTRLRSKGVLAREFRSLPNVVGFRLGIDDFLEAYSRNREAYEAYLELAATTASKCPFADAHSPAVLEYLEQELSRDLPRPKFELGGGDGSGEPLEELDPLFDEFLEAYWTDEKGKHHSRAYDEQRESARAHWKTICRLEAEGKDITDAVLLGVLPHRNSVNNRERGAWVNIAPAVTKDIREWFEGSGWTRPEDWPEIAAAIFQFLKTALDSPERIGEACALFSANPLSKGFQSALLSPFLNAMDPEQFLTVNSKPLKVVNHFWRQRFTSKVAEYPEVNAFLRDRVAELESMIVCEETVGHLAGDVFDQFCHYLVAEREEWPPQAESADDWSDGGGEAGVARESTGKSPAFAPRAFELLAALSAEPTKATYARLKDDLKTYVESPLREIMRQVAVELPSEMREVLETEKGLLSRFPKNDYGRGGAWDFLWSAFFPRGGRRTTDAHLFINIRGAGVGIGFSIGDYADARSQVFLEFLSENRPRLISYLDGSLGDLPFQFGRDTAAENSKGSHLPVPQPMDFAGWLAQIDSIGPTVLHQIPVAKAIMTPLDDLVDLALRIHTALFPLALATVGGDADAILDRWEAENSAPGVAGESVKASPLPVFSVAECSDASGFAVSEIERWLRAIARKRQAILYGPPGTGKTFMAELLARHLVGGGDGAIDLVQFHPSYGYEEFMQGIRPSTRDDGSLAYSLDPGRFLTFCNRAARRQGTSVLIIDEINRANLSRVFGELMYLLEYRNCEIPLAGGGRFNVPANVVILGTMNTADRSIALVDNALRRRFAFLPLYPRMDVLKDYHVRNGFSPDGLISILERINTRIGDPNYQLGISFFLHAKLAEHLADIWQMEIEPYLEEHFFDQRTAVDDFRWDRVRGTLLT